MRKESFWLLVAVVVACLLGGRVEFNDEVLGSMPDASYDALRAQLGDVSTSELVDAYVEAPEYWDSIARILPEE
jgi:hypothetical protein